MDDCLVCGFGYRLERAVESRRQIVRGVETLALIVRDLGSDVGRRRELHVWSPLEYSCHVRDVLIVQRERVLLARRADNPTAVPMGRDERADHDGYSEQTGADVAIQLEQAGQLMASALERLDNSDWERTLVYNYPDSAVRSLRWLAVHTQHEVEHHLLDVTRQLD